MCAWKSSWAAPGWPPPAGRAGDGPGPSRDSSPLRWTGSPSRGRCWSTTVRGREIVVRLKRFGVFLPGGSCRVSLHLVDLEDLRPNVLLLPQTLSGTPVGRRKDDRVWAGNTTNTDKRSVVSQCLGVYRYMWWPEKVRTHTFKVIKYKTYKWSKYTSAGMSFTISTFTNSMM